MGIWQKIREAKKLKENIAFITGKIAEERNFHKRMEYRETKQYLERRLGNLGLICLLTRG